jgi:dephospho-CoA kinase
LQRLEAIVHPAVKQVIDAVVEQAEESVIVVEAIKLIEAGMHRDCDALWVVTATPEQQAARLTTERGLSKEEAWLRIRAQSPQSEKVAQANVVIENSGSRKALEQQVDTEWRKVQAILHRSGA